MSDPVDMDGKSPESLSVGLRLQEQQNRALLEQLDLVSQLLRRTCHLSFGLDPELDNDLQRLSNLMLTPEKLTRSQGQLAGLSDQLGLQQDKYEKRLAHWQASLNDTLKQLNQINGLPSELRRQLKALISDLHLPRVSLYRLLPLTQEALSLLLKVATLHRRQPDSDTGNDTLAAMVDQLVAMVSSLNLSGADHELHQIRRQLLSPITQDGLLDLTVEFLQVVIKVLDKERRQAKQFLQLASDSLKELHQRTTRTLGEHHLGNRQQQVINGRIDNLLVELTRGLDANNLQQAGQSMAQLSSLWQEKMQLEAGLFDEQRLRLEELQQQVADLETRAEQFRNQLAQQRLDSLSDSLTQLPNRAAFDERLLAEHKRLQRFGHPLWMAILDVDHFKDINDRFGHIAGDKTLRVIAHTIRRSLRDTDFIARFGGEEFVILFPELEEADLHRPLTKIREAVRNIPFKFKDESVRVTVSIGATEVHAAEQPMVAFERADQGLYQAKNNGRDQVVILSRE
ncbi:diguanylate cyclase [Gallaecimonas pentaromativorans]|uniref:GGDEF domain-containing protein n=1 Tax=Gallaecimonas pentaromativorans TaxID=584787 RepID=UPI003A8E2D60